MEATRPSQTALRVALRRAAHQLYDAQPLILEDPIAVRILGAYAAELERTPGRVAEHRPRPYSVGLRALLVVRSRVAEDLLREAVAKGVGQYVVLGAGLDTFAHRNPYGGLRVFEVDHPATQRWKRELLAGSDLIQPARLTYVPVDFECQSLEDELRLAGWDAGTPTFFSWLGVVPYLTLSAFRSTIAFVASQPSGSGLVFDYAQPRAALPLPEQLALDSLSSRVALAGEYFKLFFTPAELGSELGAFHTIEDVGSTELNERYFSGRSDRLRLLGEAPRIAHAWI